MRKLSTGRGATVLAFVLGLLIATAGTATAAKLITGKQIKDGSITERDLAKSVRGKLANAGTPGPAGVPGPKGDKGDKGDPGDPGDRSKVLTQIRSAGNVFGLTDADQVVLSMPVEAGAYVARATLHAGAGATTTVSCRLETSHGGDGRAFMSRATIAAGNQSLMLPAELADSWTTGSGTVSVTCRTLGDTAMIDQAILTVTPVGSIESPIA